MYEFALKNISDNKIQSDVQKILYYMSVAPFIMKQNLYDIIAKYNYYKNYPIINNYMKNYKNNNNGHDG